MVEGLASLDSWMFLYNQVMNDVMELCDLDLLTCGY